MHVAKTEKKESSKADKPAR